MDNLNEVDSTEWRFDKLISATTYSVRYMAKLGQIALEEASITEVTTQARITENERIVCVKEPEIPKCSFQDLPINVQLLIFSYLDAKTLCKIAPTCQHWYMLSEDELLWSKFLELELHKWRRISNATYPPTYLEANSELTPKQIYSRCYPNYQSTSSLRSKSKSTVFELVLHNLQSLKTLFHRRPLKVVMFGPGLESADTKMLIQKLLWDKTSPFKVTGMFAGEFEGVGSGVCLQLQDSKVELNLITLYGSTRAERENLQNGERISRLLLDGDNNDEQEQQAEVSHSVKELCRTVDAFMYVVDSSTESAQKVKSGNRELHAMMNVNWTIPTVPLLVLSCTATETTQSESCAKVTELLDMRRLSRPWMVNSVCVETMEGFLDGFTWLVQQ